MNAKDLLRKPVISYKPSKVLSPEPESAPSLASVTETTPTAVYAAEIKESLTIELRILNAFIDQVAACVPDSSIEVPEELVETVGSETISLSDYMSSAGGLENRDVLIQDIFEDHHCSSSGEPAALLLPLLTSQKSVLTEDLEALASAMSDGFSSSADDMLQAMTRDAEAFANGVEYGTGEDLHGFGPQQLWTFQQDLNDSQELREDVLECAEKAAEFMDSRLWPALFDDETTRNIKESAQKAVALFRKIRGILVISMSLQAVDYKTVVPVLRDYIQNYIVNVQLKAVINTALSIYCNYTAPVMKVINRVINNTDTFTPKPTLAKYIPTVDTDEGKKNVVEVVGDIAKSCSKVIEDLETKIADAYICSRKQTQLRKKGSQAILAMVRIKRVLKQIDTIIVALQTATLQPVDALYQDIAPGKLATLLETQDADVMDSIVARATDNHIATYAATIGNTNTVIRDYLKHASDAKLETTLEKILDAKNNQ